MSQPLTLDQWLAQIEAGHPTEIELGLVRVAEVARAMQLNLSPAKVITVAGTNGKGSTTRMLDSILSEAGYATGVYTSPHFERYNERIRINGIDASDTNICEAFSYIDQCRNDTSLTYFEYGTLAALWLFQQAGLDYIILEVGLGGRLDAVNIIDADLAILTSVALDHTDWLGDTLDKIGYEKAGVFRSGRPAIVGMLQPPASVIEHANTIGAQLYRRGVDFDLLELGDCWSWEGIDVHANQVRLENLPIPSLPLPNAATVIQALQIIAPLVDARAVSIGLHSAKMTGRMQREKLAQTPMILDVAHNPEAAQYLAERVRKLQVVGKVRLVLGMLADKDRPAVIKALASVVDHWHLVSLNGPRASTASSLAEFLPAQASNSIYLHTNVATALEAIKSDIESDRLNDPKGLVGSNDLVLVCGSFLTVTEALRWLNR